LLQSDDEPEAAEIGIEPIRNAAPFLLRPQERRAFLAFMNPKFRAVAALLWIFATSAGCASWRESIHWDAKAEKEHLEPYQEREQLMRQLAEPR
jgi:hypothetical protein